MDKINHLEPNRLILRIQPDEGISMQFNAKKPGTIQELSTVDMDFSYIRRGAMEVKQSVGKMIK